MPSIPVDGRERASQLAVALEQAKRAAGLAAPSAALSGKAALAPLFGVVGVLFDLLQRRQEDIAADPPRDDFDRHASLRPPAVRLLLPPEGWQLIGFAAGSGGQADVAEFVESQRTAAATLRALRLTAERQAGAVMAGANRYAEDRNAETRAWARRAAEALWSMERTVEEVAELDDAQLGDLEDLTSIEEIDERALAFLFLSRVTYGQLKRLVAAGREATQTLSDVTDLLIESSGAFRHWLSDWDGAVVAP